jgi:hypothetical protein
MTSRKLSEAADRIRATLTEMIEEERKQTMYQLTIVYQVQAEDGVWLTGIYQNLFATYEGAKITFDYAAGEDNPEDWKILEWDIT